MTADRKTAMADYDRMGAIWEERMGQDGNGRTMAVWAVTMHLAYPELTAFALYERIFERAFPEPLPATESSALWFAFASNTLSEMFRDRTAQRLEWIAANEGPE